jgi:hypothetical protein
VQKIRAGAVAKSPIRNNMRRMARISTVALLAALVAGLAGARAPAATTTLPSSLSWGGRSFVDRSAFETWLRQHGRRYDSWARLHPRARTILERAGAAARAHRPKPSPVREAAPAPGPVASVPPSSGGGSGSAMLPVLLVLAALLVAVAAVPFERLLPSGALARSLAEKRILLAAPGIAIVVGVAIAKLTM